MTLAKAVFNVAGGSPDRRGPGTKENEPMPTTYDMRETLTDLPDAARQYIVDLLRLGGDETGSDEPAELPDPEDYGLTEEECQRYVEEAMPRIVQTIGGPSYHLTPPPAGATYQQVVEHYTTQVQQIAGDYYEVSGDGNIVGEGAQGITGDGSTGAFGEGAQAQSGAGNLLVGGDIRDSAVGEGAQNVSTDGGDIGAVGFGDGDVTGTTGNLSPAGDDARVTFGTDNSINTDGDANFGTQIQDSTLINDSFQDNSVDIDDSFQDNREFTDNRDFSDNRDIDIDDIDATVVDFGT